MVSMRMSKCNERQVTGIEFGETPQRRRLFLAASIRIDHPKMSMTIERRVLNNSRVTVPNI